MTESIRKSFGDGRMISEPLHDPLMRNAVSAEFDILAHARGKVAKYDEGITLRERGIRCSPQQAAVIGEVEGAAAFCLLSAHKHVFSHNGIHYPDTIYRGTACNRHVSYLWSRGELRNTVMGGDKLFLGCGTLLPEALPFRRTFVHIDAKELTNYLLSDMPDDIKEAEAGIQSMARAHIRTSILPGRIIGVENNGELISRGIEWCKRLKLDFEALQEGVESYLNRTNETFDLIGIIRLDPYMIGLHAEKQKYFFIKTIRAIKKRGATVNYYWVWKIQR